MSHSKFSDLAGAARRGILVTLTVGLRVVERAQPLRHTLHFLELYLITLVCLVIHQAVAFAVEAGRCFLRLRSLRSEQNQRTDYHPDPHVGHPFGVTSIEWRRIFSVQWLHRMTLCGNAFAAWQAPGCHFGRSLQTGHYTQYRAFILPLLGLYYQSLTSIPRWRECP